MKNIWNEGRVVGLSAYEIYLKQHLAEDPNSDPASEKEWLASSLAMGSSMIMKLKNVTATSEDTSQYVDIMLPANSNLCAANTIVASFFDGECVFQGDWATSVTDYGQLIATDLVGHKNATSEIPSQYIHSMTAVGRNKLKEYMKIIDGLVIQPGFWGGNTKFKPELTGNSSYPRIRLLIKGSIRSNPYILLTGFTIKSVIHGIAKEVSTKPEDGDFLGPSTYPWANKIVFSVPSAYISYFAAGVYKRQITGNSTTDIKDTSSKLNQDTPVIDMKTTDPATYYNTYNTASRVPMTVNDFATLGDGEAVLTVYQKKSVYPPALYGTFVSATGQNYLHPLDVVAPGTVKMFPNATQADLKNYEDTFPGTFGVTRNDNGTVETLNSSGVKVPIADVDVVDFDGTGTSANGHGIRIRTGGKTVTALSLVDNNTNHGLPVGGQTEIAASSTSNYKKISWRNLVHALRNNEFFNIATALKYNIKDFIVPGRGISKSVDSDGKVTLSTNLTAGSGISLITNSEGRIQIVNSKPYDPAGTSYTLMYNGIQANLNEVVMYDLYLDNYVKGYPYSPTSNGLYVPYGTSQEQTSRAQTINSETFSPIRLRMIFSQDYDATGASHVADAGTSYTTAYPVGKPKSIDIEIVGNRQNVQGMNIGGNYYNANAGYRLGICKFSSYSSSSGDYGYNGFMFRHTADDISPQGQCAILLKIRFRSKYFYTGHGYVVNLYDIFNNDTNYSFVNTSVAKIWNINEEYYDADDDRFKYNASRIRASWYSEYVLERTPVNYNYPSTDRRMIPNRCHLYIVAASYGDGYNTQILNNYSPSLGGTIMSHHLNMLASGTLFKS